MPSRTCRVVFAGSIAKDEYVRGVQAPGPPPTPGMLRDEVVAELKRKMVYLSNIGQRSSGLEGEACSPQAMSSQRRSGTAPR